MIYFMYLSEKIVLCNKQVNNIIFAFIYLYALYFHRYTLIFKVKYINLWELWRILCGEINGDGKLLRLQNSDSLPLRQRADKCSKWYDKRYLYTKTYTYMYACINKISTKCKASYKRWKKIEKSNIVVLKDYYNMWGIKK